MVLISYSGREINAKLVYYGPGLSGKTTNLEYIYGAIPQTHRGKMVSMKTKTERTLFFDFLPIDLGELAGFKTRFLLYTVPGQVYYNATRKLVLKGVDAIVFVADSKRGKMEENLESIQNLRENLKEQGLDLDHIPWAIQYNKRDLPDVYAIEELERVLNPTKMVPSFEAVGTTGIGVFETFKAVSRLLLRHLSQEIGVRVVTPVGGVPASHASGEGAPEASEIPGARPALGCPPVSPTIERAGDQFGARGPASDPPMPRIVITPVIKAAYPIPPPIPTDAEINFASGAAAGRMVSPTTPPPKTAAPAEPTSEEAIRASGDAFRSAGVGDRLRRWLGRSHENGDGFASDFDASEAAPARAESAPAAEASAPAEAVQSPTEATPSPPEAAPQPVPVASPAAEPTPIVEPDTDPDVQPFLEPFVEPVDEPTPIPTLVVSDGPRTIEVPITIDPEDLERGVVLQLRIRAAYTRDSQAEDPGEAGRAKAA